MSNTLGYGEIKSKKNIFPSEARKIAEKGCVGILVTQAPVSKKTKAILDDANITLYEGVTPELVNRVREEVKIEREKQLVQKNSNFRGGKN